MNEIFVNPEILSVKLQLSGIIEESISNGPGLRMVIFAQGCKHNCKGCHNPQSHDFSGGYSVTIADLLAMIAENPLLDGVTFSGGDPVEQAYGFGLLAELIQSKNLNVTTYTGYTFESLMQQKQANPDLARLLAHTDLLIDGPFLIAHQNGLLKFRGSENQRLLDMTKSLELECPIDAIV